MGKKNILPTKNKQVERAVNKKLDTEIEKKSQNPVGYVNDLIEKFKLSDGIGNLSDERKKAYFRNFPQDQTRLPPQEANWCLSRIMLDRIKTIAPQGQKLQRNMIRNALKSKNEFNPEDPNSLGEDNAKILNAAGIDAKVDWIIDLPVGSLFSKVAFKNGLDYIARIDGQYYMAEAKSSNSENKKSFKKNSVPYLLDFVYRLNEFYRATLSGKIKAIGIVTDENEKKIVQEVAASSGLDELKKVAENIDDYIWTVPEFIERKPKVVEISNGVVAQKVVYAAIRELNQNFKINDWFSLRKVAGSQQKNVIEQKLKQQQEKLEQQQRNNVSKTNTVSEPVAEQISYFDY